MTGDVSGDLTGRRLGNYRIDGVLGKGGMSVMYRATDVRLGRKVALKVIGDHLGADAEFRERFVDEARNTSAIDHANVVPVYDFGELDGMLYIAMRLVDGSDLASLISGSAMAPERALGLLDQVADALDTLHERGLVHLDVKPANVLVTSRESAREHVYIADFGLTRRGTTGHRTRGGDFLGSPTYAAPEHLRGEPLDGRTDQYALACMLFACLTGKPPFSGDVQTVIKGHLSEDVPSVSQVVPALPQTIDAVVRKGMAKSAEARYVNCVELVKDARAALEQRAHPPSTVLPSAPVDTRPGHARIGEGAPVQPFGGQPGRPEQQSGQQPGQPAQPGLFGQPMQAPYGLNQPGGQAPYPGAVGPPSGPQQVMPGGVQQPYGTPPHGSPMPPHGSGYQAPPPGGFPPPPPPKSKTPWIVWVLTGVIVVGIGVAVALFLLNGSGDGDDSSDPIPSGPSTAPSIPIGPGGDSGGDTSPSNGGNPPPSDIPVVPGG